MRHARLSALVVAVALGAAACSSSGADPEPTPSTTATESESESETPSPTPTASEMDLSAPPPDQVTEEYVQKVLEAIYEVEAEVIRREVAAAEDEATAPPKGAVELLSTIYDGEQLTFALRDIGNDWENGELVMDFRSDAEPSVVEMREIVDVASDCIVAQYRIDDGPTVNYETDGVELMAILQPKPKDEDPEDKNASPWVITHQAIVNPELEASCNA